MTAHEKELEDRLANINAELRGVREENERLRKECDEMRNRFMTRFEQFKSAENPDVMAFMLHKVYMSGVSDGKTKMVTDGFLLSVQDMSHWLQEVGKI